MNVELSKFPYQNFAFKNFQYAYFTVIILSGSLVMSGLVIHPILDKKDPPEDKELYSIHLGHYRRLYPSSLVAKVTKTEAFCYQKWLTLAQRHKIGKKGTKIGVMLTISQPHDQVNRRDNSTIIFTSANENLTQFVEVLLIKVSEVLDTSKFVKLFHHQSFALYGMHYTVCTISMHYTVCTIRYALYGMYYTVCTIQYAQYSMHYTVCTIQFALYSMHYTVCTIRYALYSMHYTVCTIQYALYGMHYTVCTIRYALYGMHYTVCTIQYALYGMHYTVCTIYKSAKPHGQFCSDQWAHVKYFQSYLIISVVHVWPYPTLQLMSRKTMKTYPMWNRLLALYCSLFLYLKSFIYNHTNAKLSIIYAVHYPCYGSPYEPYLAY